MGRGRGGGGGGIGGTPPPPTPPPPHPPTPLYRDTLTVLNREKKRNSGRDKGGWGVGVGGGVLVWLVGGLGARQPKRGGMNSGRDEEGGGVGVRGGVGGGGGWGGGVRGPETGLAGRRPRSQKSKTSGADTLNRQKRIWLNSGRDRGGGGLGVGGGGKFWGEGGAGKKKAEAGGRQRRKSFTVRTPRQAGVGGLIYVHIYIFGRSNSIFAISYPMSPGFYSKV